MGDKRRDRPSVPPISARRGFRRRRGMARRLREAWGRRLESPWPWLAVFVLVATWALLPAGFFGFRAPEAEDVARRDYVAPRHLRVEDQAATAARRQRARRTVPPVYNLDTGVAERTRHELQQVFNVARRVVEQAETADEGEEPADSALIGRIRQALLRAGVQPPTPRAVQILLDQGLSRRLEERLDSLADEIYQRGLVADKPALLQHRDIGIVVKNLETEEEGLQLDLYEALDHGRETQALIGMGLRTLFDLDIGEREALTDLLLSRLRPNLVPDPQATRQRRDAAAQAIPPTYATIRQGEVIVRAGDRITATQAAAIAAIDSRPGMRPLLLPVTGNLFFSALLALALWLTLSRRITGKDRQRRFAELLFVLTISLLGARFCLFAARALSESFQFAPFNALEPYQYAAPFAAFAIICQLLFGRQLTLLASVLFAVAIGRMLGDGGIWYLLYALAGSLTALFVQEAISFKQRSALVRTGLAVGGVNILMLLLEAAVRGGLGDGTGAPHLAFALFCGLVSGLLAAGIASFLVPILEILLSATTEIKLVELANTNLPLLQRLALEAPGTFQHSLMVANLAKAGCTAIGADPVLAYTGGLYHDIGKVMRPEYFIENQRPEQNPHDRLSPAMSALVIISHVKDGLELGREHHLPQPLLDAIAQHHGTRRISFFFDRARQRAEPRTGRISDEKYRYAGPRPQNKVMAVLMLADGVEAASRTLTHPTPGKLRSVIRAIRDTCMAERQFDETNITLKELHKVSRAFLQLLVHVYHRRLEYPGSDFDRDAGEQKGSGTQETRSKERRGREGWRVIGGE